MLRPAPALKPTRIVSLTKLVSVLRRSAQAMTARALTRLVLPYPILADVEPQKIQSRLVACQGVADASFAYVERQSDFCQPCCEQLLTVVENCAIRVKHQTIIRISDDAGLRIDLGDGRVHPMQGDQRQQR